MAGMLPGVEAARRRRIHNTFNYSDASPRPNSFSLYATTHHSLPKSSMREFPVRQEGFYDESLHMPMGVAAREAKKRLDNRFHSQTKRNSEGVQSSRCADNVATMQSLQVPKLTKNKPKRLKWLKIGWMEIM